MEYAIGPILALLLGMKFTDYRVKKVQKDNAALVEQLEEVKKAEQEVPKKLMATLLPVAKAVQKLNQEVGIQ